MSGRSPPKSGACPASPGRRRPARSPNGPCQPWTLPPRFDTWTAVAWISDRSGGCLIQPVRDRVHHPGVRSSPPPTASSMPARRALRTRSRKAANLAGGSVSCNDGVCHPRPCRMSRFVDLRRSVSTSPAPRPWGTSQTGPQRRPSRGSTATSRQVAIVTVPACHPASVHRHTSRADGPSLLTQVHGRQWCARRPALTHCPAGGLNPTPSGSRRECPPAASHRREPRPATLVRTRDTRRGPDAVPRGAGRLARRHPPPRLRVSRETWGALPRRGSPLVACPRPASTSSIDHPRRDVARDPHSPAHHFGGTPPDLWPEAPCQRSPPYAQKARAHVHSSPGGDGGPPAFKRPAFDVASWPAACAAPAASAVAAALCFT